MSIENPDGLEREARDIKVIELADTCAFYGVRMLEGIQTLSKLDSLERVSPEDANLFESVRETLCEIRESMFGKLVAMARANNIDVLHLANKGNRGFQN